MRAAVRELRKFGAQQFEAQKFELQKLRSHASELQKFARHQLKIVERAHAQAEELVSGFYMLAPRERERLDYEVRTLARLAPEEITDRAFAEVRCYDFVRRLGPESVERHDFYRICVQDHRILHALESAPARARLALEPLLLYIFTHELVHVVRFSQRLQRIDLAPALRPQEEQSVEQTTRRILAPVADRALQQVINKFEDC